MRKYVAFAITADEWEQIMQLLDREPEVNQKLRAQLVKRAQMIVEYDDND